MSVAGRRKPKLSLTITESFLNLYACYLHEDITPKSDFFHKKSKQFHGLVKFDSISTERSRV